MPTLEVSNQKTEARTELRNIHFGNATADERRLPQMETEYRQVNRSPDEEFSARVQAHGAPQRFPQSIIALILQKQRNVTVTKKGITFDYQGTKYQFWSPTSLVCANDVDKRVLVTFDPDDMAFCHILTEDGRHVESVPQKNKVAWFDDEAMRAAMRDKAHALNRDLAQFQAIHQATSEQKAQRVLSNAEKMQIVNTIPAPGVDRETRNVESETLNSNPLHNNPRLSRGEALPARSRLATNSRPAPSQGENRFAKADQIQDAIQEIRRQRISKDQREEKISATRFSEAEMAAATGKEESQDQEYKISAEEIAGVLSD